jgi:hypothetical protein
MHRSTTAVAAVESQVKAAGTSVAIGIGTLLGAPLRRVGVTQRD